MSDRAITIIRWLLLFGAVTAFLQGTVLFGFVQRRLFQPWLAFNDRHGARVPAVLRDPRVQRGWPLLMAALFGGLWWYSGTPAGHDWLLRAGH